ncbi:MAG TPA: CAP domain-containing protein [Gaiellaceae bacterium]|nr:CAP domain-containing protein [Gaiellaceae bacterium]
MRLLVGAFTVLVAALAAGSAFAGHARRPQAHRSAVALTRLEQGVLHDINVFRRKHGLAPVRISTQLTAAARQHSREMAHEGYFAHSSGDGSVFWKRIQRFYGSHSWGLWSVGENLLWSSPTVTAARALTMWEHSPEHRENLLTPRWREIGISAVHASEAPGAYHGLDVTIVTTDFGVRR